MKRKLLARIVDKSDKKRNEVFGQPLRITSTFDEKANTWLLPAIIPQTILRISSFLKEEGIFRLSGNASVIAELKEQYNSFQPVDLSRVDPHVCCGLLKLY